MTVAPPRRRWFRYSLRTLFVLVTVVGVWLGVHLKWIRDRHDAMSEHEKVGIYRIVDNEHSGRVPLSLRILGEQAIYEFQFHGSKIKDEEELQRRAGKLRDLFPETFFVELDKGS